MCGGNNGPLFSLLAIKIHPTTKKGKRKKTGNRLVEREEEEGRWCIQKSFAGDLYVADGSEWKLFFLFSRGAAAAAPSVCVFGLCSQVIFTGAAQHNPHNRSSYIGGRRVAVGLYEIHPSPFFLFLALLQFATNIYTNKGDISLLLKI